MSAKPKTKPAAPKLTERDTNPVHIGKPYHLALRIRVAEQRTNLRAFTEAALERAGVKPQAA